MVSAEIPTEMGSALITEHGKWSYGRIPVPQPGPGQVLIKVHSATINPSDLYFMKGMYKFAQHDYPFTPGWEGCGEVVKAGEGAYGASLIGQKVSFGKPQEPPGTKWRIGGTMAEYALADPMGCIPIGDEEDIEKAAFAIVNPLTVLGMLERVKELGAKSVILTAAASQLCRMMIRVCKKEGIEPICIVRKEEQAKLLREDFGVSCVVNTSESDWKEKLGVISYELKPKVCLEACAGEMTGEIMKFMTMGGTVILYGLLNEQDVSKIDPVDFIFANKRLESFFLGSYLGRKNQEEKMGIIGQACAMRGDELSTVISKRFGFHQFEEAVDFYLANQTSGKVLL